LDTLIWEKNWLGKNFRIALTNGCECDEIGLIEPPSLGNC
jgi:hypothetical protein